MPVCAVNAKTMALHGGRTQLLLLDDGKSCEMIAEFLYLDDDTIRGWHKAYRQGGWDALAFDTWKGGQSRRRRHRRLLCATGWTAAFAARRPR